MRTLDNLTYAYFLCYVVKHTFTDINFVQACVFRWERLNTTLITASTDNYCILMPVAPDMKPAKGPMGGKLVSKEIHEGVP